MSKNVNAQAYYGVQVNGNRLSAVAASRLAAASGPYIGRGSKCVGNDDTCGANRVSGHDLCAGHLKAVKASTKKDEA